MKSQAAEHRNKGATHQPQPHAHQPWRNTRSGIMAVRALILRPHRRPIGAVTRTCVFSVDCHTQLERNSSQSRVLSYTHFPQLVRRASNVRSDPWSFAPRVLCFGEGPVSALPFNLLSLTSETMPYLFHHCSRLCHEAVGKKAGREAYGAERGFRHPSRVAAGRKPLFLKLRGRRIESCRPPRVDSSGEVVCAWRVWRMQRRCAGV